MGTENAKTNEWKKHLIVRIDSMTYSFSIHTWLLNSYSWMTCLNNCRALASHIHTILFVWLYSVRLKSETKKKKKIGEAMMFPRLQCNLRGCERVRTNGTANTLNFESKYTFSVFSFRLLTHQLLHNMHSRSRRKKKITKFQRHCYSRIRTQVENPTNVMHHHIIWWLLIMHTPPLLLRRRDRNHCVSLHGDLEKHIFFFFSSLIFFAFIMHLIVVLFTRV